MTTTLLLIRHGETAHNAARRWRGQSDVALSALGEAQAALVAERLELNSPPDAVYSSDLRRAHDTARVIAERVGCPLHDDARLREIHVGTWADLTTEEIRARNADDWSAFESDTDGSYRRGQTGETAQEVATRMAAAISEITKRHVGQRVAIVSHGFALRGYLCGLLQVPFVVQHRISLNNCSLSTVSVDTTGEVWITCINDTSHLT